MERFNQLLAVFSLLCLSSCYDGWERRNGTGTVPTTPTTGKPTTNTKPIYYIQFVPIYLTSDALGNSSCFGSTGTSSYRAAEWAERIAAAQSTLSQVADTVTTAALGIGTSDCSTLGAVETAANLVDPSITSLPKDPTDRPIVQLKAVFWDTDVSGSFTTAVTTPQWAEWRVLRANGRPGVSLHYFDVSNPTNGHFKSWAVSLNSTLVLSATTISNVDPTISGQQARKQIAASDATALANWVATTAPKVRP